MRGYVLAAVLSLTSSAVLAQTPLPERLKALQSDPGALKAAVDAGKRPLSSAQIATVKTG